ncbi:MAG: alanine--tRNA ligase [Candidatus Micrarchaeia archaeon]
MDINKDELRKQFTKEWEKHYKLEALISRGFKRQKCEKCNRNFWSQNERKTCADASCIGYQFIGDTPVKKKLGYVDTWKIIEKYFTKTGHGYVKPYPTVARWRDDLYFTIASINDFQPYVVNGELEPPHNPLIIPQTCIRFQDISNVGVSGRHYTNFVMIGQHAFNTKKTGLFYWKNEAIAHDIEYMKQLGIPEHELVFMEDVWAGGGNFGPSMEYFVRGLELGNCVFMQYEVLPDGSSRELKTKVIDMGAGQSRLAWMTTGDPTSYEVVFGDVIAGLKKQNDISIDKELFTKFAKISGSLNEDEVPDMDAEKAKIAKMLGTTKEELFSQLEPLQALYATADHTLTTLFTVTDGMLPSNAGGGYNIRMVLRRIFGFETRFKLNIDYEALLKGHATHLKYMFPYLQDGVDTTITVIEEEKKKYMATKESAAGKVVKLLDNAKGGKISTDDLFVLYKSHGIPPDYVVEVAKEKKINVEVPGNFYKMARESDEKAECCAEDEKEKFDVAAFEKTEIHYYTDSSKFEAKVLGVVAGKYIVLDRSAFYPEGGGQVADLGKMNGEEVKNVIKTAGVMLHEIATSAASKFKTGTKVSCEVDLKRRKIITAHHTSAHLLNAACREVLGKHIWQGGSHKDDEKAHLDVTHYKRITQEELNKIEAKVNEYIRENIPIKVEVLARNKAEEKYGFMLYQGGAVPGKELRIVSVGDIDSEACGGTHHMLSNTGEIGYFKIVKREGVQDGIERITYKAGSVAVKYMQDKEALLREASGVLAVSETDLVKNVERFFTEWKEQKKKIERMGESVAKVEAESIVAEWKEKKATVCKILEMDAETLKKIGLAVSEHEGATAVLLNQAGNAVCAAGKGATVGAKQLMEKTVAKLGGSGGGSPFIASGKVNRIERVQL